MASLKDIAAACGVSIATVSKALRDQKDIGEETKERIRGVANEMGYFPNAAARALKTNRSGNIGVLYEEEAGMGLKHEYFSGVLQGFKSKAGALGYDITFINSNHMAVGMSYLEHCRYRNFDGVVIVCSTFSDPDVLELMNSDIPTVTIDYVHYNCSAVTSNNVKGMESLLEYIVGMGHSRIAYIHGQDYSSVTRDRMTAFYRFMEGRNLEVPEEYIKNGVYLETKPSEEHTKELLNLKERPSCIIYPDDTALIGGINAINELGLKIPEDVSVAGYDGTRFSQLLYPKLTTIRQNTDEIGSIAAKNLIRLIEKPKSTPVEHVTVDGILIQGDSVGRVWD